ncbi:MAG: YihY/virulence factor BrkB family protein [Actinomycetota bacterium]|nr:YihY/virulence factor BrkB family protein [Actinomycetota bacterium]
MIERLIARFPGWAKGPAEILAAAAKEYGLDRAARMAAAITYRTVFALAPMLVLAVSIAGFFLGSSAEAQRELLDGVESFAGPDVKEAVATLLRTAVRSADTAALVGFLLLLWTASSLFIEVQHDLNDIFDVPYERISGPIALVRSRGIGFLWVFGLGILMIALWLVNAIWSLVDSVLPSGLERLDATLEVLTPLVSLTLLPFVFGLIFRTLTAANIKWRAAWAGGLFTSVVFIAAAYGVRLYFTTLGTPTALGFAGSFVIILLLANILSAVFLFGAEVTKVYADRLSTELAEVPKLSMPVDPLVVVAEPSRSLPGAALFAFLSGLLIGWRRRRR